MVLDSYLFAPNPPFDYVFLTPLEAWKLNLFSGKPVEMTFTHKGRYLWVPYYRRDFDTCACNPSAVAVIDTQQDKIVRVFSVGPIPKWVVSSPDGQWLAVVHWGDNTVGLIDIREADPRDFKMGPLIVIRARQNLKEYLTRVSRGEVLNRDKECGLCLRGAVFTPDGRYLLVGLMSGGGIAVIDMVHKSLVGIAQGIKPTPRHLVISPDGKWLYVSSTVSGYVTKFSLKMIEFWIENFQWEWISTAETYVGRLVRTIALSPDGDYLYVAVFGDSKVTVLRTEDLKKIAEIKVDPYPVGLDVSFDGKEVWVTSQGWKGKGGHSVNIIEVRTLRNPDMDDT